MKYRLLSTLALLTVLILGVPATVQATGHGESQECDAALYDFYSPQMGQTFTGESLLKIVSYAATAEVASVDFLVDGNLVGQAESYSTGYYWSYTWNTVTTDNGSHTVAAQITNIDGSSCLTRPQEFVVQNNVVGDFELLLDVNPVSWQGPININKIFSAFVGLKDLSTNKISDATEASAIEWQLSPDSPGYIGNPLGHEIVYSSGPNGGEGTILVTARSGSKIATKTITVKVEALDSGPTSYPEDTVVSGEELLDDEQSPLVSVLDSDGKPIEAYVREGDEEIKTCMEQRLGDDYTRLASEQKRLNFDQFLSSRSCFAASRYVVPANLSPVDPSSIRELSTVPHTRVTLFDNVSPYFANKSKALTFKGVSEPNAVLLLFVYSEPLVLTTTADSEGRWSYTLEDPLEPGQHEIFVAVEKDGNIMRSEGKVFAIAEQPASLGNPNGFNLRLSESFASTSDDNTNTNNYLIGAGALVLGSLLLLSHYVWHIDRKKSNPVDHGDNAKAESTKIAKK